MVWHIKTLMDQPSRRRRSSATRLHDMADRLLQLAEKGNLEALKIILERIDGKVKEQVDVTLQRGPLLIASPLFGQITEPEMKQIGPAIEPQTPVSHSPIGNQAPRLVLDIEAEPSKESAE